MCFKKIIKLNINSLLWTGYPYPYHSSWYLFPEYHLYLWIIVINSCFSLLTASFFMRCLSYRIFHVGESVCTHLSLHNLWINSLSHGSIKHCLSVTFIQVLKKADMIRKNAVKSVLAERDILISVCNPFVVSRSIGKTPLFFLFPT